jgi:hypothetical protein
MEHEAPAARIRDVNVATRAIQVVPRGNVPLKEDCRDMNAAVATTIAVSSHDAGATLQGSSRLAHRCSLVVIRVAVREENMTHLPSGYKRLVGSSRVTLRQFAAGAP